MTRLRRAEGSSIRGGAAARSESGDGRRLRLPDRERPHRGRRRESRGRGRRDRRRRGRLGRPGPHRSARAPARAGSGVQGRSRQRRRAPPWRAASRRSPAWRTRDPVNDDPSVTSTSSTAPRQESLARIHPIAAATRGLAGQVMTEMIALRRAGAVALQRRRGDDHGRGRDAAGARVLDSSSTSPMIVHAEDCTSAAATAWSTKAPSRRDSGSPAIRPRPRRSWSPGTSGSPSGPAPTCTSPTSRPPAPSNRSAGPAKRGVRVTAEVTPHHLTLTDEATMGFDTSTRVAPPLRSAEHVEALPRGSRRRRDRRDRDGSRAARDLREGSRVHRGAARHDRPRDRGRRLTSQLVREGVLSPLEWIRRLSTNPARILGLDGRQARGRRGGGRRR